MLLMACLLVLGTNAQDTAYTKAVTEKATVYFGYGAEISHKSTLQVGKQTRFLVIDQLSTSLDLNSLQISCPEEISILSQRYDLFVPPAPILVKSVEWLAWEDSLQRLQVRHARLTTESGIAEETIKTTGRLIEASLSGNGDKNVNSTEILKLVQFYNREIEQSRLRILELSQQMIKNQDLQQAAKKRLKELAEQSPLAPKVTGRITLQVLSRKTGTIPIQLSYYTARAGWTPVYDLRVNSTTNKIRLLYKASLTQTTGIDWKQTRLTLSTGTPNFGVAAPVLSPWYLQLYVPELYRSLQGRAAGAQLARNSIQSFADDKSMNEVVITGAGRDAEMKYKDTIQPYTVEDFTTLQAGQLNTNFDIDLPYDINSDGEMHAVRIREEEISASLKNYVVPRVDREAYLLAEVADWQNLDLLPGDANVIMDDTYIGKSVIDPNTVADTLNLPLGRDKRLTVKRSAVKELSSLKSSGGYYRQTFTYEIVVKNTKSTEVNALVKDQVPRSNIKEVEVKLDDAGEGDFNEEVGVLTWKLKLAPGESRKMRFSYTVKYPKDKRIINLK